MRVSERERCFLFKKYFKLAIIMLFGNFSPLKLPDVIFLSVNTVNTFHKLLHGIICSQFFFFCGVFFFFFALKRMKNCGSSRGCLKLIAFFSFFFCLEALSQSFLIFYFDDLQKFSCYGVSGNLFYNK